MTFTDVEDLIRLLDEHPRLKSELRLRLFEEEWAPFMKYVREVLASSLAAIEELKQRATAHDERLAEVQADIVGVKTDIVGIREEHASFRTEVDRRFDAVDRRFDVVDQRFDVVDQRFDAADQRFSGIDEKLVTLNIQVDDLRGRSLERDFRDKVHAFVGTFLLGTRIVLPDQLPGLYEAYESGALPDEDYRRVVATDAVVRGRLKGSPDSVYIAVEVSATINERDVERAKQTADILNRLGLAASPMVFGNKIRTEAQEIADRTYVRVHLQVD